MLKADFYIVVSKIFEAECYSSSRVVFVKLPKVSHHSPFKQTPLVWPRTDIDEYRDTEGKS